VDAAHEGHYDEHGVHHDHEAPDTSSSADESEPASAASRSTTGPTP
jgi:zinc transport system permease protein